MGALFAKVAGADGSSSRGAFGDESLDLTFSFLCLSLTGFGSPSPGGAEGGACNSGLEAQ